MGCCLWQRRKYKNDERNWNDCVYKGVNKNDPTSVIVIEQGEEGKAIAMFKDPEVKPLIESAGHIYDSTVISSYF